MPKAANWNPNHLNPFQAPDGALRPMTNDLGVSISEGCSHVLLQTYRVRTLCA